MLKTAKQWLRAATAEEAGLPLPQGVAISALLAPVPLTHRLVSNCHIHLRKPQERRRAPRLVLQARMVRTEGTKLLAPVLLLAAVRLVETHTPPLGV